MKILLFIGFAALTAAALLHADHRVAGAGALIAGVTLIRALLAGRGGRRRTILDVSALLCGFLLAWQLAAANFRVLDPVLFPTPEEVLKLFFGEFGEMFKGMFSSLYLLGSAYFLALATAIPAGLAVGCSERLRDAAEPFSKVLSAIPPIVYIPYAIALLPSFSAASVFIIWSGAFWPVFVSTISGVVNIPETMLDSARMLHLKRGTFIFRVLLPGAMPSILTGASLSLVFSFLLLTAAELIGATEGLGWYVKDRADFGDYARVIVGIIFIGLVITAISAGFKRIEKRILHYKEAGQ